MRITGKEAADHFVEHIFLRVCLLSWGAVSAGMSLLPIRI
jgi:hypothetical protein